MTPLHEHHQEPAAEAEGMIRREPAVWEPVTSKSLKAFRYDPVARTFDVRFHSGAEWRYQAFSQGMLEAFHRAPSKGKFFHKHIKGHFDSVELRKATK